MGNTHKIRFETEKLSRYSMHKLICLFGTPEYICICGQIINISDPMNHKKQLKPKMQRSFLKKNCRFFSSVTKPGL